MFTTPAVAGNTVYVGACPGSFFALDADTATVEWTHDTADDGDPANFHGDALITDELVVVGADATTAAHLYAFERADGAVRWKLPFPGGVSVQVLRHGDTAVTVAANGEVLAVDLETGSPAWLVEAPKGVADAPVRRDPALHDGRLFVARYPGRVDAYDASTGELVWSRDLGMQIKTSVAVFRDQVVVGTAKPGGGALVRLDPDSGEVLGTQSLRGEPNGDPRPAGECLVLLTARDVSSEGGHPAPSHHLSCIEPASGDPQWSIPSDAEWSTYRPLVLEDQVVAGHEGRLVGVSKDKGAVLWERHVDAVPRGLGASEKRLYVGTLGGEIRAVRWSREQTARLPNEPTEAPFTGAVKPVVYVDDAETSARFYEEVLGFEHLGFSELDGAVYYAEMAAGGTKFGLHEPTAAGDSERIGRLKLYFRVRNLDAHRERIAARDGEPGPVRETPYMDLFAVDDPDGNRIVFGASDPERHDFDPWTKANGRGSAGVDPCR